MPTRRTVVIDRTVLPAGNHVGVGRGAAVADRYGARVPRRRQIPVVERTAAGFVVHLEADERAVLGQMLGQLRDLLTGVAVVQGDAGGGASAPLRRLFPPAYVGGEHAEAEAEYQRLMHEDLVAGRLEAIATVRRTLDDPAPFDEEGAVAFLQSMNNLRLVLGTLLDVDEEHDPTDVHDDDPRVVEHHVYAFLSWLVDATVAALSVG